MGCQQWYSESSVTVKCEAKGDASTGVFVLDEREQLLLFRPREPQSLS